MVSGLRTVVCTPTGQHVLLFRGAKRQPIPFAHHVRDGVRCATDKVLPISGEVAEWQTRTVQVRVPERA